MAGTLEALQAENRRLQRELHRVSGQRDILKKNLGYPLRSARQRFARIKALTPEYALADLCQALAVTRSGYHAGAARRPGPRVQANAALLPRIEQAQGESRRTYGSPRVHRWLVPRGPAGGRHRLARLLRQAAWRSVRRRRFRPLSLTDSNHARPIAPNRLRELSLPARRDAVWVADITDVNTGEGWLHLAAVLDRWTRRGVGWARGESLATSLPLAARNRALAHRQPPAGLIHHPDRGGPYASESDRQRLAQAGVVPSMSRRGNGYDNALMESFWSSRKRELVHRVPLATRAEARAALFEWIEIFYNRERLHGALGDQSPVDFETQLN